jgi:uncharacterized damage-inducible protein DinB
MPEKTLSPAELLAAYRSGPAFLRAAIEGLDLETMRAHPIPGKWSVLEVVCHIVDSDQFMADRMKRTIATKRPLLMGVESADYIHPLSYENRDLHLDLQLLEVTRSQMAADLDRLHDDAWNRTAVHSENGLVTLVDLLDHAVDHLESHAAAIAEKRAALQM